MLVATVTAETPGLGDDLGLTRVLLGVEHLVVDATLVEQRDSFSDFSTEMVPTSTGWPCSFFDRCPRRRRRTCVLGLVDEVGLSAARSACASGSDHLQVVGVHQLGGLGLRRTGHAGELVVHAEVVLQGDGGERLVLLLDRTPSLASTAWWMPSDQRRPSSTRPVNSSTIFTSPSAIR
jgi:hypothetical protein